MTKPQPVAKSPTCKHKASEDLEGTCWQCAFEESDYRRRQSEYDRDKLSHELGTRDVLISNLIKQIADLRTKMFNLRDSGDAFYSIMSGSERGRTEYLGITPTQAANEMKGALDAILPGQSSEYDEGLRITIERAVRSGCRSGYVVGSMDAGMTLADARNRSFPEDNIFGVKSIAKMIVGQGAQGE